MSTKIEDIPLVSQDDKHLDQQDIAKFVTAILAGSDFTKQYSLFDDKLRIQFRTLTSAESDAIWKEFHDDEFMYNKVRLALSIDEVWQGKDRKTNPRPNLLDRDTLVRYADEVMKDFYPTETLAKIISAKYNEFYRLVEMLEEAADSPDFWKDIP